ncbi:SDR family NAD(P)-dependent oxidoreductase [Marinobacter caseinilyticus]|uniref:SDR family NAD(P)-dependent oxidoreductase n=1 Tax=Marinobacter caseinilyticus TaxID=2692195 RepID=UPI00140B9393|nr:SDR family NAD(P)-dependent oxidoreductase [Marinobacter caseinilyticus]
MKPLNHVMITGAGSGLGLGLALRYLKRGAAVSVLDLMLSDDRRTTLEAAARTGGAAWQFLPADVSDELALGHAVTAAVAAFGAPDLAINSAGVALNKAFSDTTAAEFRRVVGINLNGSFQFAAAVLPTLQPGGRLALVASLAGLISNYGYSAYGASKFGVVGLATTLRYEYEPLGIHLSCICPPEVDTPMVADERLHGNPVSLELKQFAGSLDTDVACDQMVAGLDAGRWMIIPGHSAKLTAGVARYLPGPFFAVMNRLVKRILARQPPIAPD